jgi:hypothetical protein
MGERALVIAEPRSVERESFPADGAGGVWDEARVRAWLRNNVPLERWYEASSRSYWFMLELESFQARVQIAERDIAMLESPEWSRRRTRLGRQDDLELKIFGALADELVRHLKEAFDAR